MKEKECTLLFGSRSYIGNAINEDIIRQGLFFKSYSSKDIDFLNTSNVINIFKNLDKNINYNIIFLPVINKLIENSFNSYLKNLQMINNLIEGMKYINCTYLIFFSSVDVYGNYPKIPISEDSNISPDNWYGLSKFDSEIILKNYGIKEFLVLRIPGIIGVGYNDKSILNKWYSSSKNNGFITLYGDGSSKRDYVDLDDLVNIIRISLNKKISGTINISKGISLTIKNLTNIFLQKSPIPIKVFQDTSNIARSFDLEFNNRLFKQKFSDYKFINIDKTIEEYWAS
jgi:nucleoside-diphosphate-sugar epimerase